jgi:hypothetical protein
MSAVEAAGGCSVFVRSWGDRHHQAPLLVEIHRAARAELRAPLDHGECHHTDTRPSLVDGVEEEGRSSERAAHFNHCAVEKHRAAGRCVRESASQVWRLAAIRRLAMEPVSVEEMPLYPSDGVGLAARLSVDRRA